MNLFNHRSINQSIPFNGCVVTNTLELFILIFFDSINLLSTPIFKCTLGTYL